MAAKDLQGTDIVGQDLLHREEKDIDITKIGAATVDLKIGEEDLTPKKAETDTLKARKMSGLTSVRGMKETRTTEKVTLSYHKRGLKILNKGL